MKKMFDENRSGRTQPRLETKITVSVMPLADGVPQPSFMTTLLDLSGKGCKLKLPRQDMPEFEQAIVSFFLDTSPYKIYGEIVRWNKRKGVIAVKFTYLYDDGVPQINWQEYLERRFFTWGLFKQMELDKIRQTHTKSGRR